MYELIFSKLFNTDIDSTYLYIVEYLGAPMVAKKLMKTVKQKLESLKENPTARPILKDSLISMLNLRTVKVKNCVIYYSVDEEKQKVNLVRFLYNKRDWINILSGKRL
jgi:plasmid stabilization system protein ParE